LPRYVDVRWVELFAILLHASVGRGGRCGEKGKGKSGEKESVRKPKEIKPRMGMGREQ